MPGWPFALDGAILLINDGPDALVLLSRLSDDRGVASRLLARLLRSPGRARLLYPAMKLGRRVTLLMLGRTLLAQSGGATAR